MKHKKILACILGCCLVLLCLSGCGSKKNEEKVTDSGKELSEAPVITGIQASLPTNSTKMSNKLQKIVNTPSASSSLTPASNQENAKTLNEKSIDGIVLDATMNSVMIQTQDGHQLTFMKDGADSSGLKEGLLLGNAICITYTGTIENDATDFVKVLSISDSAKAPLLSRDSLEFAGGIILAIKNKNMESLADYIQYPFYIGLGLGQTIHSRSDFLSLNKDEVFSKELISAVTTIDLMNASECEAGVVLGNAKPNIIFGKDSDGNFGITGINYNDK